MYEYGIKTQDKWHAFPLANYSNDIGPTAFVVRMIDNDFVQVNLKLDP